MEDLPEGLLSSILLRLPLKDLLRSKATCRRWKSLISSRLFVDEHARRSQTQSPLEQIILSSYMLRLVDCDSLLNGQPAMHKFSWFGKSFDSVDHYVVGCCNGLACLVHLDRTRSRFWLWNPATREIQKLGLVIPLGLDVVFGFGYDPTSDDYKIIIVRKPSTCLYSVKSSSCKTLPTTCQGPIPEGIRAHGVHLNAHLHWPALNADGSLLSFDLKGEIFVQTFSLPGLSVEEVPPAGIYLSVGVIRDCLCLCMPSLDRHRRFVRYRHEVWVMKEYGVTSSWTKLTRNFFTMDLKPLVAMPDGKVIFHESCEKFAVYDPREDTFSHKRCSEKSFDSCWPYYGPWVYKESLISPRTLVGTHPRMRERSKKKTLTLEKIIVGGASLINLDCDSFLNTNCDQLVSPGPSPHRFSWIGKAYDRSHEVVGICNGLVLLHSRCKTNLLLWNPATKEIRKLRNAVPHRLLVFGFGYDSSSNDYKVVMIQEDCRLETRTAADVYSLRSGSRRTIPIKRPPHWKLGSPGLYLKGRLHWPVLNGDGSLMSFDLKEEIFPSTLLLPGPTVEAASTVESALSFCRGSLLRQVEVGVIGGCLSVCLPLLNHRNKLVLDCFEAWVMKEYGITSSWTKIFRTAFSSVPLMPLVASQSGKVILEDARGRVRFAVYDPRSDTLSWMKTYPSHPRGQAWAYKESLVSPLTLSSLEL